MADVTGPDQRPPIPLGRRRDKPQLSCNLCRTKKLRCDRKTPCSSCVARRVASSCAYTVDFRGAAAAVDYRPRRRANVQDRVNHLEKLVLSLMCESGVASAPTTSPRDVYTDAAPPHDDLGRMSLASGATTYVGGSHWHAVLDDIAELKRHFSERDAQTAPQRTPARFAAATGGPELMCGPKTLATREEVLAALPPRVVVDQLVATYFDSLDFAPAVIHNGKFIKEYEYFWSDPSSAPVMWIGMLYSIMCLAAQYSESWDVGPETVPCEEPHISPAPDDQEQLSVQALREKIVQCFILGDYLNPGPYTAETLLLYFAIEYFISPHTESGTYALVGTIVRIAMRMGYHRDPSHTPAIKLVDAEMRRRNWATIVQLDIMISAQVGLPRILKPWHADTAEPRNFANDDLNEESESLPPARSDGELTTMLPLIARNRMGSAFGVVLDLVTSMAQPTHAQIAKADQMLDDAFAAVPPCLQPHPPDASTNPPRLIMHRVYIESIYRKAQCVLHRRSLHAPHTAASRRTCVSAALAILRLQRTVDDAARPGGPLHPLRWRALTLVNNDFLLATTVLCVELHQRRRAGAGAGDAEADAETAHIEAALAHSQRIWVRASGSSREAQRAVEALAIVLGEGGAAAASETIAEDAAPSPFDCDPARVWMDCQALFDGLGGGGVDAGSMPVDMAALSGFEDFFT